MIFIALGVSLVSCLWMIISMHRLSERVVELSVRVSTLEQSAKIASDRAVQAFNRAAEASVNAQEAREAVSEAKKSIDEFIAVLNKVVQETPALPFAQGTAALGRVSAIRHHLKLMEERSGGRG